jgi:type II secretory pathway component PulF
MPTFVYEAMNASGKPQKGTLDAPSSEEVIKKLRGDGLFPTSVKEQKAPAKADKAKTDAGADGKPKNGDVDEDGLIFHG